MFGVEAGLEKGVIFISSAYINKESSEQKLAEREKRKRRSQRREKKRDRGERRGSGRREGERRRGRGEWENCTPLTCGILSSV